MGLILKLNGQKAPVDSPTLLRHALVNEASLLAHDFSNGGSFIDDEIKNGYELTDLSKEISLELGVNNRSFLKTAAGKENSVEYTEGGGILMNSFTQGANLADPQGFNMGMDLPNYLVQKQPPLLAIFWVRSVGENNGAILSMNSADGYFFEFRKTSTFHVRMAGASSGGPAVVPDKLVQLAVEFRGAGQTLRRYTDGGSGTNGTTVATGFSSQDALSALIGSRSSTVPSVVYYGGFFYDLSLTERTAEELVKENWDYIQGTGVFEGKPTKRPFIDAV